MQMEASSSQNEHQSSIKQFLERSRCHVDKFFPLWRTSGKSYIIPPDSITKIFGPIEVSASYYDDDMESVHEESFHDDAKSIVHNFISKSKQPAFVLQNFATSNWKRMLGSFGYEASDSMVAEMKKMDNIEIDFLILHAYAGIIGIESKPVINAHSDRSVVYQYNECKKRLNKINDVVESFGRIIQVLHDNCEPISVPIKKVVSFPFVDMKEEAKDPYNLGKFDITKDPHIWWNRLLGSYASHKNRFQTSCLYQDFVLLVLGMYSAVNLSFGDDMKDVYTHTEDRSFCEGSSNAICLQTKSELPVFDNLFFLNPEQQQVMKCQANKLFICGDCGTGKSVLLILKSIVALMNGEKVVFVVPKNLKPKYSAFKARYKSLGKCKVTSLESFSGRFLGKFKNYSLFIDDSHCFLGGYSLCLSQNKSMKTTKKVSDRSDIFIRLGDYAANNSASKIMIAFSSAFRLDSSHFENEVIGKNYDDIFGCFQIFYLKSVMRGSLESAKISTMSPEEYEAVTL